MAVHDLTPYTIPVDTPVSKLDCLEAFQGLSEKEKLYAYHLSKASWEGALICLLQTSPESAGIFLLFQRVFGGQSLSSLRDIALNGCSLTEAEYNAILVYASAFYSNMGNYKSFGDTKFIPDISSVKFHSLITSCEAYKQDKQAIDNLWDTVSEKIYSLQPTERELGFKPEGITTYYSGNCNNEDAEFIKDFMTEKNISPYNTRLFKTEKDGKVEYEVRLASALITDDPYSESDTTAGILGNHRFKDTSVTVSRGDYAPIMKRINEELSKAKDVAANGNEVNMMENYIASFNTGSIDAHKNGSRYWIRNKGPIVETYIGFIESYRDPFGVRGEFEGFVAVVNKTMSRKFTKLVESAESLLTLLPWPKDFEKDKFLCPDFTSLDVLAFGSSGVPAGINIPNYDDIRQDEGFKNVSLGNVLSAAAQDKRVSFLAQEEQDLYVELRTSAFEVQVGLHELLGHGSGKLFKQDESGQLNFDVSSVLNPVTNQKITSWYGANDTWDTVFSSLASSYEECRAECVGIYLCTNRDVLSIFGYEGPTADDIFYVNWLNMVRSGLLGLEYYTPEISKWRQAHMQGRYVILRVLMECDGFVSIEETTGNDGLPDLVIRLDRPKIETVGVTAIGEFLKKLQVFKSIADFSSAQALYSHYSSVSPEHLKLRDIVLKRKMPRRMLVQPHASIEEGEVKLTEFESSPCGIVQSFVTRFPVIDADLESLWSKDREQWK